MLSFTGAGAANNVQERARRRLRLQPLFVTILEKKKKKKNGEEEEEEEEDVDEER